MSNLTVENFSFLNKHNDNGKTLYKQNKNYRNISTIMEHPEFRNFFNTYFNNRTDIQTIIMFMNVYKWIEDSSPIDLTPYEKISLLDKMFKDSNIRQEIVNRNLNNLSDTKQAKITF